MFFKQRASSFCFAKKTEYQTKKTVKNRYRCIEKDKVMSTKYKEKVLRLLVFGT